MIENSGILYKYVNKDGQIQKAKALHMEQTPNFTDYDKLFLRLLNDDLSDKTNNKGQKMISVRHIDEVTQVGYTD